MFSNRIKVGIVGDSMVDIYHYGKVKRISPEFPVPILLSEEKPEYLPGGAANVTYQFKHFNTDAFLFSFIDEEVNFPFDTSFCVKTNHKIPRKIRFYDDDFPLLRCDYEKQDVLTEAHRDEVYDKFLSKVKDLDIVILSNYNKGLFSHFFTSKILAICRENNIPTITDPKSNPIMWQGCSVFKPNSKEAESMTSETEWKQQCLRLNHSTDASVVITQQGNGVVGLDHGEFFEYRPKTLSKDVNSVIGAGDCFTAVLALCIGNKMPLSEASKYAFEAGVQYVKTRHNRPITMYELHRRIDPLQAKIVSLEDLAYLRFNVYDDLKWVLTGGCFDILHSGHLSSMQTAKKHGDRLVVAINSDDSVKRLKGPLRPIQPLGERQQVIAALECVDFVVSFNEDTPYELIKTLQPDVLVKGSHYKKEDIAGSELVKEVILADIVEGNSTTNIIERIRKNIE